ncbi:hypothetical protein [Kutzneria sp. 744]|uniref:hypothetical protein n=1 Tax=Kutzneria sp. (strain 744) TaxID=345341 RepID=UPI0004B5ED05|nr:hypothetical protein [Kutzneria sp. 744]
MTMPPVSLAPAPRRGPQPALVTLACYLLAGVAALRLVAAIAAFFAVPEFAWLYSQQYGDDERGQVAAIGIVVLGVCSLLVAGVYLVLALLDGAGKNWARVLTWITGVLTVIGTVIVLAVDMASGVAWYRQLTVIIAWVTVAFAVGALVLLAVPPAHRYYRSLRRIPPPAWLPPPPGYRPPSGYGPPWYGSPLTQQPGPGWQGTAPPAVPPPPPGTDVPPPDS